MTPLGSVGAPLEPRANHGCRGALGGCGGGGTGRARCGTGQDRRSRTTTTPATTPASTPTPTPTATMHQPTRRGRNAAGGTTRTQGGQGGSSCSAGPGRRPDGPRHGGQRPTVARVHCCGPPIPHGPPRAQQPLTGGGARVLTATKPRARGGHQGRCEQEGGGIHGWRRRGERRGGGVVVVMVVVHVHVLLRAATSTSTTQRTAAAATATASSSSSSSRSNRRSGTNTTTTTTTSPGGKYRRRGLHWRQPRPRLTGGSSRVPIPTPVPTSLSPQRGQRGPRLGKGSRGGAPTPTGAHGQGQGPAAAAAATEGLSVMMGHWHPHQGCAVAAVGHDPTGALSGAPLQLLVLCGRGGGGRGGAGGGAAGERVQQRAHSTRDTNSDRGCEGTGGQANQDNTGAPAALPTPALPYLALHSAEP